jgi:hypothetical protein
MRLLPFSPSLSPSLRTPPCHRVVRPLLLALLVVAGVLLGVPASSSAEPPTYDGLVKGALVAYDGGRFVEARSLFKRAHALSPSARTLRGVGMCSFNLGDYVDAMLHLEAALDEESRPLSVEQRAAADELVDRASRKIGRFRLTVDPPGADITVDGGPAVRSVRGDILVEPGRHELSVRAASFRTAQRTLSVDPGDRAALEIRLEHATPGDQVAMSTPPPIAPAVSAPVSAPLPTVAPRYLGVRRFGIASITLGAASLALFAVTGSQALHSKSELDSACRAGCPPAKWDDLDAYDRQRALAAVGAYSGAALVGAGIAALWWRARHTPESHSRITPVVGLGYAGIAGRL